MGQNLTTQQVNERIKSFYSQNVELISEYVNKRSIVSIKCNDCGHIWDTIASNILYLEDSCVRKQCPNCKKIAQLTGQIFKCAFCQKEVYRPLRKIQTSKSGLFYCSVTCGNRHKNIVRQENGEWDNSSSAYRRNAFEKYNHKCTICGWDEDERILEVHHIDEDRTNNVTDNLIILCPICHRKITLKYYELRDNSLIKIR